MGCITLREAFPDYLLVSKDVGMLLHREGRVPRNGAVELGVGGVLVDLAHLHPAMPDR